MQIKSTPAVSEATMADAMSLLTTALDIRVGYRVVLTMVPDHGVESKLLLAIATNRRVKSRISGRSQAWSGPALSHGFLRSRYLC